MRQLILPITWILAICALLQLGLAFNHKSEHFFGIVDAEDQAVSFQYPVEILKISNVLGKQVKQGDPLLIAKRQELTSNQAVLDTQIRQFELTKQEAKTSIDSQIDNLQARKRATLADMDYQIHNLETSITKNKELLSSISGIEASQTSKATPEIVGLNALKAKREYSAQAIQAEIDHLLQQKQASSRPIDAQLAGLHLNKAALKSQDNNLKVNAQFDGQITAVNAKVGELIAPFQPIIALHRVSPSSVTGYIHETIYNDIEVGQRVWIQSINPHNNTKLLTGIVSSLGKRIVEYPKRLQVNPSLGAWGREVVINFNGSTSLLFGEKVQIFLNAPKTSYAWLFDELKWRWGSQQLSALRMRQPAT